MLSACSGTSTGGHVGDGGCVTSSIWPSSNTGFKLTVSGGLVGPPADAGCPSADTTHEFSIADETLTQRGCVSFEPVDRTAHLTQPQVEAIVARVASLHTACSGGCGADAPDMVLTLHGAGGDQIYNSNFYAGCQRSTIKPPFVSFDDLTALYNLVFSTVADACGQPNADAGVCASAP
jgi:hypothetical protein